MISSKILTAFGLVGMAAAFPQASTYGNTTVGTNGTTTAESFFCPSLDEKVYGTSAGATYLIQCGTNHYGTVIDIVTNTTGILKRQTTAPTSLGYCLTLCDAVDSCVGAAYNNDIFDCTLFSEISATYTDTPIDFAILVAGAATTATAGQTLPQPVTSTAVSTVYSCAPTVTNCPLSGSVVTEVIVTSTDYICPTATVIPAAPVACSCSYSSSNVIIYSSVSSAGTNIAVAVTSAVVAIPSPSGTVMSTTICPASSAYNSAVSSLASASSAAISSLASASSAALSSIVVGTPVAASSPAATVCGGCAVATGVVGTQTSTSGITVFTGAASQFKAGMGMAAMAAGAALLI